MQRMLFRVFIFLLVCSLMLVGVAGSVLAAPVDHTDTSVVRQMGPYAVANGAINVRGGPGVGFWLLGYLGAGEIVPINNVSPDGAWWYVNTRFGPGWVAGISVTAYDTEMVEVYDPGLIGSVSAGALYVRSGAGERSVSVGTLGRSEQVYILAQSTDGNWLQIQWAYGTGWVAKAYIVTDGFAGIITTGEDDEELPLTSDLPYGVVTATFLNLRSGPGLNYTIIGYVYGGEELAIVGRSADSAWYEVETRFGNGWISASFLATRNEYGGTPITTGMVADEAEFMGPIGVVNSGAANVRSGPGPQYTALGTLAGAEEGQIYGRNANWTWWLMNTRLGMGWVYAPLVVARGDISGVPYVEPGTVAVGAPTTDGSGLLDGQGGFEAGVTTETAEGLPPVAEVAKPQAVVTSGALNIRSGPNAAFSTLGSVYGGAALTIIGQSPDRGWWLVESEFGNGWISKAYVVIRGNTSGVPVVQ